MKLLIIGRTGQLGSSLINNATSLGHIVIAPNRQELDITKIKNNHKFLTILEKVKPDYVINTAAYNNVNECDLNNFQAFDVNCFAVKNMAELTNKLNIPFITFSTDYVFDGAKNSPYIELDEPHPINMYGISKLSGEYASLMYENTTVIRTCGLYGLQSTSTKNGKGNFVDNRIRDSKVNQFIQIGCDQIVCPTFTDDLSKATLQLINQPSFRKHRIYHLVNEGFCTWYEFTREIYDNLNIGKELVPINRMGKDKNIQKPLFSAMKNEKAKEFGITLPHWKDAIKRYLKLKYNNYVME